MMKKYLFHLGLAFLIISCNPKNQDRISIERLNALNSENDSLRKVIKEINSKYVFDSIAVRDIPDYKNTYSLNSVANGEIVFVGYNLNKKSNVILVDSFSLNPEKLYNPDTLLLKNGGYIYSIQLDSEKTEMSGIMKLNNKYGKSYKSFFKALIVTN